MKTKTLLLSLGGAAALLLAAPAISQELRSDTSVVIAAGEKEGDIRVTSAAGSVTIEEGATAGNINTRDGLVRIDAKATAGRVATIDGDVFVRSDATVDMISTDGGDVTIDAGSTVTSIRADSAPIVIGENVTVKEMISTRDGDITVGKGSTVGENIVSQEGLITIAGATIKGVVVTTEGGVWITDGAVLEGGLTVMKTNEKKPRGLLNRSSTTPKPPVVVIGADVKIKGPIDLKGLTRLYVHEDAEVMEVKGGSADSWSGEEPPLKPTAAEGASPGRTRLLK